eukprot:9208652-Alexandrium_andersonii.AAC.1
MEIANECGNSPSPAPLHDEQADVLSSWRAPAPAQKAEIWGLQYWPDLSCVGTSDRLKRARCTRLCWLGPLQGIGR